MEVSKIFEIHFKIRLKYFMNKEFRNTIYDKTWLRNNFTENPNKKKLYILGKKATNRKFW